MIISLTGFMGCGKSSVGKELSALLCCDFVDLDREIESSCGRSISQIFEEEGESGFRVLELSALKKVLEREEDFVLSLGGGTITIPEAADLIHSRTKCFYLRASAESLKQWLREDGVSGRPMLKNHSIEGLLEEREMLYSKVAHYFVDVESSSYLETAKKIIDVM